MDLKPCLKSLILALLPALEEENDIYERVFNILENLCLRVGDVFFYHCLWIGIISSPRCRYCAFLFLLKKFGNSLEMEDIGVLIGHEAVLMVRALSLSLSDSRVMVQRHALDFLLKYLSLGYCLEIFKFELMKFDILVGRIRDRRDVYYLFSAFQEIP